MSQAYWSSQLARSLSLFISVEAYLVDHSSLRCSLHGMNDRLLRGWWGWKDSEDGEYPDRERGRETGAPRTRDETQSALDRQFLLPSLEHGLGGSDADDIIAHTLCYAKKATGVRWWAGVGEAQNRISTV